MRPTKLVFAAAAVMVALLVAFAAPAMANGNGNNNNGNDSQLDRQDIRLDQQLLNNGFDNFNNFNRFDNNNFGFNRFDDNNFGFNNFNSCFNFPFCNDFDDDSNGAVISGGTINIIRD